MQVKKGLLNLKKIIYEQQQNINQLVEISEEDAIKYGFINNSGNEPSESENPDTPITPEEPDEPIIIETCGQWYGYFGAYYVDANGVTYNSYESDIVFYPEYDHATYGYGYQVDWYEDGEYYRISYKFTWEQDNDNNIIKLYYEDHPELNVTIRDCSLNNDYFIFIGYINNIQFKLRKIADYYDWSYYSELSSGTAWDSKGQIVILDKPEE